jgi:hypothetical protein
MAEESQENNTPKTEPAQDEKPVDPKLSAEPRIIDKNLDAREVRTKTFRSKHDD